MTDCPECSRGSHSGDLCVVCWGDGSDPNKLSDWLPFNIGHTAKVRFLNDHLSVVQAFEAEAGHQARDQLMDLYGRHPERFVRAVARLQEGRANNVADALARWSATE